MKLEFSKMHGLGNDFVVIDAIHQTVDLSSGQVRALADRHTGIGCDQLLLVERAQGPEADFRYRIFNADGGEVEQCGNGARCFARFVHDRGLTDSREIPVGTAAGDIRLYLEDDRQVRVNMGQPFLQPDEIPFKAAQQTPVYPLDVDDGTLEIGAVSMGNPHCVIYVDDLDDFAVKKYGYAIENHAAYAYDLVAPQLSPADARAFTRWRRDNRIAVHGRPGRNPGAMPVPHRLGPGAQPFLP